MENEQADAGQEDGPRLARPNSQVRTGTEKYYFPCSADQEHDWQLYPIDPYSDIYDTMHTYIHKIQPEYGDEQADAGRDG